MKKEREKKKESQQECPYFPASKLCIFVLKYNTDFPKVSIVGLYCYCCFRHFYAANPICPCCVPQWALLFCWHSFWSPGLPEFFSSVVATVMGMAILRAQLIWCIVVPMTMGVTIILSEINQTQMCKYFILLLV